MSCCVRQVCVADGPEWEEPDDRQEIKLEKDLTSRLTVQRGKTFHLGVSETRSQFFMIKKTNNEANLLIQKGARNECQILKTIGHRHIVEYVFSCETSDSITLVTKYYPGGDLHTLLIEENSQRADIFDLFLQLVEVMRFLHDKNIAHRDLKLENVLLNKEHTDIFLCDFEFSVCNQERVYTSSGTPLYTSPEVMLAISTQSLQKIGVRPKPLDMWALGVVLWGFLKRKAPFDADDMDGLVSAVLNETPPFSSISDLRYRKLARGLLEKDPAIRLTISQVRALLF